MQAYRIVNWWKFELLKNGKLATAKTKMQSLRIKPLVYVRFPVHGHTLTADYRRMVKRAGNEMAAACDGVYKMLVGLAGNQVREYRSWILDDRQQPLDPRQVAELLCLSEEKTSQIFEILTDNVVRWVSLEEFPESLHKSMNRNDLSSEPQFKKFGNNQEQKGSPLNETETVKDKDKRFVTKRIETEEGDNGKNRDREGDDQGENVRHPALPAALASDSDSDTDTVPASDSEKPTASDSASIPASDSASQPGPRAGPEGYFTGPISEQQRIEIIRECQKATLELTQIIHPRNNSDTTTINDIYAQLKQRVIAGCPYPLFEMSLNTARQCWRGNNPIAMFVAAMKKPPFYYVPKKLSVVPGKFSQGRKIH